MSDTALNAPARERLEAWAERLDRLTHGFVVTEPALVAADVRALLGAVDRLEGAPARVEERERQLAVALGRMVQRPRWLSIGSHENTAEVRVSRAVYEEALRALALVDDASREAREASSAHAGSAS